jgi:hypothetical protein
VLWKRLSAARNAFTKRRKAYFASLEAEREASRPARRSCASEAEALSSSTDWGPTTSAYRELMRQWKEAGRAGRDDEAELWKRFRAAQDKFFTTRTEVFSAKETELREHAEAKQQLLDQAQALLPVTDWRRPVRAARHPGALGAARRRAAGLTRAAGVGAAPGRGGGQASRGVPVARSNPEALARAEDTVAQLRSTIAQLEDRLAKARERDDARAVRNAEEALTARRAWLEEAEHTLAEFSS